VQDALALASFLIDCDVVFIVMLSTLISAAFNNNATGKGWDLGRVDVLVNLNGRRQDHRDPPGPVRSGLFAPGSGGPAVRAPIEGRDLRTAEE